MSDSGQVTGGATSESQSNIFAQQLEFIEEALMIGRTRNNLFIDLKFDEVSLVLPSKRVYEVIYNRLGNDMLLWLPEIFRVKEFLYDQPIPDPLQDPDLGFSTCFSGNHPKLEWDGNKEKSDPDSSKSGYVSFPRDKSSALTIHIDTCVMLNVNKLHAAVSSSSYSEHLDLDQDFRILTAYVESLNLCSVVGLEKEPEIVLFNLGIGKGKVGFGNRDPSKSLNSYHFNWENIGRIETLIGVNDFRDRAWVECPPVSKIMKMTAKILFDAKANLKTINLAFSFKDISASFA